MYRPSVSLLSGIALATVLHPVARAGRILFGSTEPDEFAGDAVHVYQPVAEGVIAGTLTYGPANMNKPGGWWLVNLIPELTSNYWLVGSLLMGIGNAAAVVAVYWWMHRADPERAITSGLLTAVGIPAAFGLWIGPRSLALPALVAAFLARRSSTSGIALGIAGAFTQFSIFAVPALVYQWYSVKENWVRHSAIAGTVAVGVFAIPFAIIALGWGSSVAWQGIRYSIFMSGSYVTSYAGPLTEPLRWILSNATHAVGLGVVLVPAALGAWGTRGDLETRICIVAGLGLLLPLLIRPGGRYWLLAVPFLGVLAARGIRLPSSSPP